MTYEIDQILMEENLKEEGLGVLLREINLSSAMRIIFKKKNDQSKFKKNYEFLYNVAYRLNNDKGVNKNIKIMGNKLFHNLNTFRNIYNKNSDKKLKTIIESQFNVLAILGSVSLAKSYDMNSDEFVKAISSNLPFIKEVQNFNSLVDAYENFVKQAQDLKVRQRLVESTKEEIEEENDVMKRLANTKHHYKWVNADTKPGLEKATLGTTIYAVPLIIMGLINFSSGGGLLDIVPTSLDQILSFSSFFLLTSVISVLYFFYRIITIEIALMSSSVVKNIKNLINDIKDEDQLNNIYLTASKKAELQAEKEVERLKKSMQNLAKEKQVANQPKIKQALLNISKANISKPSPREEIYKPISNNAFI